MITHLLGFSASIRYRWTVSDKRIHYGIPEILKELRYRSLISGSRTARYSSSLCDTIVSSIVDTRSWRKCTRPTRRSRRALIWNWNCYYGLRHQCCFISAPSIAHLFPRAKLEKKNITTSPAAHKRAGKNNLFILNIRPSITTMN